MMYIVVFNVENSLFFYYLIYCDHFYLFIFLCLSRFLQTDEELTKLSVKLKTNLRNQQKLAEKIQDMQTELESLQKKMISVDEKLREVEKKASISMDSYQKLQAQIEEIQQQLKMNHTKLTEAETNLTEIKKAEVISHRLVNQLEGELSEANTSVRHWEREIRNLKLHHIDDEDEDDGVNNTQTVELSPSVHQIINNTTNVQVIGDYENSLHQQESSSSPSALRIITQKSEQLITNEKYKSGKVKSLPKFTDEELKELSVDKHEMQRLEERISSMSPNMAAIEEYRRKAQNYLTRVSELNHITSIMGEQRQHLDDAKSKRLSEFLNGFHAITNKLKEMYQMITQGGDAELELIDSLDPFSEGIVFSVRPPKKSWKSIANLSGGEKTLSSLALVFALHHYKPTPLYVMDEIDAALDFKNVSIIGNYLKERTKNAQFIVISLRNNMFELSDRLVGIYKTYNITKTITLDPSSLMNHLHSLVIRVATEQGYKGDLPSLLPQSQPVSLPPASSQQHTSQTTIPGTQRILQTDNTENHETIVLDSCVEETILVNGDHDDDDDDDDMQTELGMIKDIVGSTAKLLSISNNNDDTTTPTTTDNNNSNNNPASVVQY
ncbi:unnamed protein product [Heterobilharzia americana]|nr:unnamed protein product [Heterobilharzia americana]